MFTCQKCRKKFRDNWDLGKHMSRVRPCEAVIEPETLTTGEQLNTLDCQKSTLGEQKSTLDIPKSTLDIPKSTPDIPKSTPDIPKSTPDIPKSTLDIPKSTPEIPRSLKNTQCTWCLNNFSNISNKIKHSKICKLINDPLRKLEIEKGIIPDEHADNSCRFCNKVYSRKSNLNRHFCKEREEYLLKLKESNRVGGNNVTINNNNVSNSNNVTTTNIDNSVNITLNIHKQENTKDLNVELLIDELRKLNRLHGKENHFVIAGNLVIFLDGQITQKVENVNAFIENAKTIAGQLLTEKGWEILPADEIIDLKIKNTANKLVELRPAIDKYNPRVFQQPDSCLTMKEVAKIGTRGLRYGKNTVGKREIKTKMKVNTIINSQKIKDIVPESDF